MLWVGILLACTISVHVPLCGLFVVDLAGFFLLSGIFPLVCYTHEIPCTCTCIYVHVYMYMYMCNGSFKMCTRILYMLLYIIHVHV